MSLFLSHQKKHTNEGEVVAEMGATPVVATSGLLQGQQLSELLDQSLEQDLAALKDIRSKERKVDVKREELIPKYREDYLPRLRADGATHPLLAWMVIWLFDIEDIEAAIDLALYCLEHEVELPERFKRDMPTFVADAILEWANEQHKEGHSPDPYFSNVMGHIDGFGGPDLWDIPDEVRAGYYRLYGLMLEAEGKYAAALDILEIAYELGAKVKTKIGELKKKLD